MGMIVYVYRDAHLADDCSNNGVSARFTRLCVVNVDGPFEPKDDMPAVKLVEGPFRGTFHLKPVDLIDSGKVVMFGGNYAATSDSRFGKAISTITGQNFSNGIAPIHDRVEY